jgi:hypothetical protein
MFIAASSDPQPWRPFDLDQIGLQAGVVNARRKRRPRILSLPAGVQDIAAGP